LSPLGASFYLYFKLPFCVSRYKSDTFPKTTVV
jgi:hypothetical protein